MLPSSSESRMCVFPTLSWSNKKKKKKEEESQLTEESNNKQGTWT